MPVKGMQAGMTMPQDHYYREQIIELFECDEEFLDSLETEELVHAMRVESFEERVYPVDQVERIRVITNLINDLDVNLAGAAVILEMREKMLRMQKRFDRILEILSEELRKSGS